MINDYKELLQGTYGQDRRDLIHAMLVYDPMNADPANGKTPYLRSKQKRKELIMQAIEEVGPYDVEEWKRLISANSDTLTLLRMTNTTRKRKTKKNCNTI